ncbi:hypothetical protein HDU76_005106 [Blyttiomyces sp. JEL0837]|nr:hypothetical protein HDU76_005106 [Blyttiomyces sp. JEL0837]
MTNETSAPDLDLENYRPRIKEILLASDIRSISAKQVRRKLEAEYGIDLSPYKANIDKIIIEEYDIVVELREREASAEDHDMDDADGDGEVKQEGDHEDEESRTKRYLKQLKKDEAIARALAESLGPRNRGSTSTAGKAPKSSSSKTTSSRRKQHISSDMIEDSDDDDGDDNEKPVKRESTTLKKRKATTTNDDGPKKRGGGFQTPYILSEPLSKVCGVCGGAQNIARHEVVKRLWEYIKGNKLQDPGNGKNILCDEALREVFKTAQVDSFKMMKLMGKHLKKASEVTDGAGFGEVEEFSEDDDDDQPKTKRAKTKEKKKTTAAGKGKKESKTKGKSVFSRPYYLSQPLSVVCGTTDPIARHEVVKRVWAYIKEKDLQDPKDKRWFFADDALKAVFKKDRVNAFGMNKTLSDHLTKVDDAAAGSGGGAASKGENGHGMVVELSAAETSEEEDDEDEDDYED